MAGITSYTGRKGQTFILGSIIFSLFLVIAFIATGPVILTPETGVSTYFSQTLGESSNVFNHALEKERSAEHISTRIHRYDRFVERRALEKGITYETYTLVVLPQEGEARFTNLMDEDLDVSLYTGSWEDYEIEQGQNLSTTFEPGTVSVELVVDNLDKEHSFDASTPRLLKHSVMESEGERWENTLLG